MQKRAAGVEENYNQYLRQEVALFERRSESDKKVSEKVIAGVDVSRVLDVGCGAGQEMLPFAEITRARFVGVDVSPEVGQLGRVLFQSAGFGDRVDFIRGAGESLPFDDGSFDLVICRLALPYMDNSASISEFARVLRPNGRLVLKIHAPLFYLSLLRTRLRTLSVKQSAYPIICMAGSIWFWVTGQQLRSGIWKGKEVFQTRKRLQIELSKNNLQINAEMPDSNRQTPSFLIVKC